MEAKLVSVGLATALVSLGVGLGFAPLPIPHRTLHLGVVGFFVLLTPFALRAHYRRLWTKDPWNGTAWVHFVTFAVLLYLVVHMVRHWAGSATRGANERLIVEYQGKTVDLTGFAANHPGGSVIWEARGKDVEEVWKKKGVAWHADKPTVKRTLEEAHVLGSSPV